MTDTDPAIEWLETDWKLRHPYLGKYCVGRQHVRPMFQVLYDHEFSVESGCYWCNESEELIVIEPEDGKE